jgi:hypothetical protein
VRHVPRERAAEPQRPEEQPAAGAAAVRREEPAEAGAAAA